LLKTYPRNYILNKVGAVETVRVSCENTNKDALQNLPIKAVGAKDTFLFRYNVIGAGITHRKAKPVDVIYETIEMP
jgi:hypothetical protein